MYLKLNTINTICGENCAFLIADCASLWVQVSLMYYLVNVDHNAMAAHLTRSAAYPLQWMGLMMIVVEWQRRGWEY